MAPLQMLPARLRPAVDGEAPTIPRASVLVPDAIPRIVPVAAPLDERELDPAPPRVLWLALRYAVGRRAARAAAWRRLQKVGAVNIEPGLWGVRAGPVEADQLASVVRLIEEAGGEATVDEIGWRPAAEVALSSRLERACERLWDDLFNAAEWYAATYDPPLASRPSSAGDATDANEATRWEEQVEHLGALFATFGRLAARDVVQSQAMERAEWTVTHEARRLIAALGAEPDVSVAPSARARRVRIAARSARSDGRVACVALVRPTIDPLWQAAFDAFEARTFAPDPTRPELRAGTFRWVGDPAHEPEVLRGLERRVRLFESSLA